jgi:hypothetical protein
MKIEEICKLSEDIPVIDEETTDFSSKELASCKERDVFVNSIKQNLESKMSNKEVDNLIEELFSENLEKDTWLN